MFCMRSYKPRSPGIRHKIICKFTEFVKQQKHYFFLKNKCLTGGRNITGKIVVRHFKSLHKNKIVCINYLRLNLNLLATVVGVFRQRYNGCHLGLIKYGNGAFCYIYLALGLKLGDFIFPHLIASLQVKHSLGTLYFFKNDYMKVTFFNVSSILLKKSLYAKAAGTFCKFIVKNYEKGIIKIFLPSKQIKIISFDYFCTFGRASNHYTKYCVFGNAGFKRQIGKKPTVRGVAMNPVDHPNGGRTKSNTPEKTPWGRVAKLSK